MQKDFQVQILEIKRFLTKIAFFHKNCPKFEIVLKIAISFDYLLRDRPALLFNIFCGRSIFNLEENLLLIVAICDLSNQPPKKKYLFFLVRWLCIWFIVFVFNRKHTIRVPIYLFK